MFCAEMLKIKSHCETTLPFTIKLKKHIYYTIKTPNKYRDCRNVETKNEMTYLANNRLNSWFYTK